MVAPKAVGFNHRLRGFLGERVLSSLAVLLSPVPLTHNSRVFDTCSPHLASPSLFSNIACSAVTYSETEEIEPAHVGSKSCSLYSMFTKPKPRPVSAVGVPPKYGGDSKEKIKSAPLTSSAGYRPMEEKEFPKELPPEAVVLVSRLQEEGYLKEANFSRSALNPVEIPANLYSRHFLKSAAERFGHDHQEIAKWLSGSHLKKVALFGCPSVERKTVFAAKKLRSFFSIQEDIVCRNCKMRSSCKFMYHKVSKEEKVILSDSMRILALLAFDAVPRQLFIPGDLKSSVCTLLKEWALADVTYSAGSIQVWTLDPVYCKAVPHALSGRVRKPETRSEDGIAGPPPPPWSNRSSRYLTMMSPKPSISEAQAASSLRHTPLQIIHVVGNFMRIWSVYSLYHYLAHQGDSVVAFIFSCLVPASIVFLALQKPWKGRALPNSQVIPTVINGGIMALYFILWGKGLTSCGPLIALLAEYAGAVLGVLSAALYGRKVNIWKKVGGLVAMLASYYLLSKGWATRTNSPFYNLGKEPLIQAKQTFEFKEMIVPISAGILSALRRVIARRVSLKNQLKRRLHAISVASATCFLFPLAMWDTILGSTSDSIVNFQFPSWAYLSTIFFGIIFIFYADNIAEERLHLVFSSPKHLMMSGACIILMEILYQMDFSLIGFAICSSILGFGIFEATSLGRSRKGPLEPQDAPEGTFQDQLQMSPLPS
ncbi:hypothetical protein Cni_G26378 [Canna indica]|uniref:Zinc transporter 5 n=1 Tax=Canna indica TaxID=4628 RepID=A0AAQ3KZM1_9LILI|nr:hypothetical protein Cni_G26378 [Canna indica]